MKYYANFTGKFDQIKQVSEYVYSLTVSERDLEDEIGTEAMEDGYWTIATDAYGIEDGDIWFLLYTPDTPIDMLNEELLSWWPGRWEDTPPQTLSWYCLYNIHTGEAFFG